MDETIQHLEAAVGAQFERIDTLIRFMVRAELGSMYQDIEDINALRAQESELLTDGARAMTQLIRERELDARAQRFFGVESYSQLNKDQRMHLELYGPSGLSENEEKVDRAIIRQQDEVVERVDTTALEISDLAFLSYLVGFIDEEEGVEYSVASNGKDDPIIDVSINGAPSSDYDFPPVVPRGTDRILVLGRTQIVLDAIEDQAIALIRGIEQEDD